MTGETAKLLGVVLVVDGDPGAARINNARRATIVRRGSKLTPGTRPTTRAKSWRAVAVLEMRVQWRQVSRTQIVGPVALEVTTYWPKMHRSGPAAGQPLGDVDATAKALLDAMQHAGVFADDAQVHRLTLVNLYDRERPRIEVRFC